jgi:hypothetical protein
LVSFWPGLGVVHFRNSLLSLSLCSFLPFENWFRFSFFGSGVGVLRCVFDSPEAQEPATLTAGKIGFVLAGAEKVSHL